MAAKRSHPAAPPPSTCRVDPVTRRDRGELRNNTASAISDANAVRRSGNARPSSSLASPHSAATPAVRVGPGATLLTRTPADPNSAAQVRVRDSRAALDAVTGRTRNSLEGGHCGDVDD